MVRESRGAMSAATNEKRHRKLIHLEISKLELVGWCLGIVLALVWIFLLGAFVFRGISPTSIILKENNKNLIRNRQGLSSRRTHQESITLITKGAERATPLKDFDSYPKRANQQEAWMKSSINSNLSPQVRVTPELAPQPTQSLQQASAGLIQPRPITHRYTVLLASCKSLENAKKLAARVNNMKHLISISQVELPDKGRWYRVQVGQLSSRVEAKALADRLSRKYLLETLVLRME